MIEITTDSLGAAIGQRLVDADHLVSRAQSLCARCKTNDHVRKTAEIERAKAVRAESFLLALIYDEIIRMVNEDEA